MKVQLLVLLVLAYGIPDAAAVRQTLVTEALQVPSDDLSSFTCAKKEFWFPSSDSDAVQDWLEAELTSMRQEAEGMLDQRPEQKAAIAVLETVGAPVKMLKSFWPGYVFRWAVFSKDANNKKYLQAIALVQQDGDELSVHGIVSRRALLNDRHCVSGGGKALLSAILKGAHQRNSSATVKLVGAPGDDFVEKVYRAHGMDEVGRTPDDLPKLQMNITSNCVGFMSDAILCNKRGFGTYSQVAWRLIPGSASLYKTCAHIIPVDLYKKQINRMLGK
eukprot:TRINITY_DN63634_c0_g1_i1.p1 TRINITY_DN63634_c0_g1~~TRINITY_DN63634_c0_g1_i1.p1  ORF type:complete len:275 (-),score=71.70 TRINITY_DN63634_c0_g1_i1:168-992(-)